ncbi:protein of unknown function [Burkholderia multivorans]
MTPDARCARGRAHGGMIPPTVAHVRRDPVQFILGKWTQGKRTHSPVRNMAAHRPGRAAAFASRCIRQCEA